MRSGDPHNVYLRPDSTFKLRLTMERLPAGEMSEPPPLSPPVPTPPPGSYSTPRTRPPASVPEQPQVSGIPPTTPASQADGFGTLDLRVQPAAANITVDGQRWRSSDEGHLFIQVPAGMHRVEVSKPGYRRFISDIEVRAGGRIDAAARHPPDAIIVSALRSRPHARPRCAQDL